MPSLGKQITCDDVVIGLEETIDTQLGKPRRFATAGPGPNLFRELWKNEDHVFAAEGGPTCPTSQTLELGHPGRTDSNILNRYPVEVLAIEEGPGYQWPRRSYWERWLDRCRHENRPDYVVIVSSVQELVVASGLQSKPWRQKFQCWNYEPNYWFIRGHEHRGAI